LRASAEKENRTTQRRPIIGIMGAGAPGPESQKLARRLGQLVAEAGWILLTGGRPAGIMEAAGKGAKSVPEGLTIGILPSGPEGPVSDYVDIAVFTGLGDARNAVNVLTSDVVIACGVEGPGTASEVALALKAGRPTVLLCASPEARAFFTTIARGEHLYHVESPEAVIELIEQQLAIPPWSAK
jgi:uncharacterized protein (TIGR00725 family)